MPDNIQTVLGALSGTEVNAAVIQHVRPSNDTVIIDDCSATTGWTLLNDASENLTTDLSHMLGTKSLEFDKKDGTNFTSAGVEKTITSVDVSRFGIHGLVSAAVSISDKTNVASAFVRLGTDSSNYATFTIADTAITDAVWSLFEVEFLGQVFAVTGTGLDLSAITYVAVGVTFDGEANALTDILWDHIAISAAVKTT